MKSVLRLIFLVLAVSVTAELAYADFAAIVVSPVSKSIVLSRGQAKRGTFVAFNKSEEPQHVSIEPRYWHMAKENLGIPLGSWLKITPLEFEVGPQDKKEIVFEVKAPDEAVGELAAMIAFRPRPKEGQPVNVVFSVSLYVTIKETEKIDCRISDFKLWKFEDRDALGIAVDLRNDGNVHLKPRIEVFVQDLFNKNLKKAALRYGKPTYPGKTQDYQGAIYNFKLRPGIYKAEVDIDFTNIVRRYRKKIYFLAGRDGKILLTLFRRPK